MNLDEYQSKQLFARYAIAVPKGEVVGSPKEAEASARKLDGPLWVVKAQVHAGGRGRGGVNRSVKPALKAAKLAAAKAGRF